MKRKTLADCISDLLEVSGDLYAQNGLDGYYKRQVRRR